MTFKILFSLFCPLFVSFFYLLIFTNLDKFSWVYFFGFILLFAFLLLSIFNFKATFFLYIALRSSFDLFSEYSYMHDGLNLAAIVTMIMLTRGLIFLLQVKQLSFGERLIKPLIVLWVLLIPSVVFSRHILVSISDYLRFTSLIIIFSVGTFYIASSRDNISLTIKALLVSIIFPVIASSVQLATNSGINDSGYMRIYGTFVHSNMLAFYVITLLFFLLANVYSNYMYLKKKISLFLIAILFFLLILTFTRVAWVSLAFTFLILTFINKSYRIRNTIFLLMVISLFLPVIIKRFSDVSSTYGYEIGNLNSWGWRLQFWSNALRSSGKNILWGKGLGTFPIEHGFYAHNDYLRMFIESGILGLIGYITMLFSYLLYGLQHLKNAKTNDVKLYSLAIAGISSQYIIVSISDNLSRSISVLTYFVTLLYLANNCFKINKIIPKSSTQ